MDDEASRGTIPILPDREHVPGTGGEAGSSDTGRYTFLIPPECKCVPGAGVVTGARGAGRETTTILACRESWRRR